MANAFFSPRQLAALLSTLDDAQRRIASARDQLIQAMAARRRGQSAVPPARQARVVRRKTQRPL